MDEYNQTFSGEEDLTEEFNPFDRFMHNSDLDMLEAALPYLGTNMRKALALYIKSMEMSHIIRDMGREEVLSACGFERRPPNPEAMLQAMKMAAGRNANPQINQLLNMMNMMRTYQNFNEMMQRNPEMANLISGMMNQNQGRDMSSMAAQMLNKNMNQEMMSKLSQSMNPEMISKLSQNMNPEMVSQLNQNINPEMLSSLTQNMNPEMMAMLSQMVNGKDFSR